MMDLKYLALAFTGTATTKLDAYKILTFLSTIVGLN